MKKFWMIGLTILILAAWLLSPIQVLAQNQPQGEGETPADTTPLAPPIELPATPQVDEVVEQLPENTNLVIIDTSGNVSTGDSAPADATIMEGDPVYCTAGVAIAWPLPAGCTAYATINQALNAAKADVGGAGTIYVENAVFGVNVTVDATTFTAGTVLLTIMGGVDLTGGSGTYGTVTGMTTLNGNFNIKDFNTKTSGSGLTLMNFLINGQLNINNDQNIAVTNTTVTENGANAAVVIQNGSTGITLSNMTITDTLGGEGLRIIDSDSVIVSPTTTINESGDGNAVTINNSNLVTLVGIAVNEADDGHGITINNSSGWINVATTTVTEHGAGNGITMNSASNVSLNTLTITETDTGHGILVGSSSLVGIMGGTITESGDNAGIRIDNGSSDVVVSGTTVNEADEGNGINILDSTNIGINGGVVVNESGGGNGLNASGGTNLVLGVSTFHNTGGGTGVNIDTTNGITMDGVTSSGDAHKGLVITGYTGYASIANSNFNGNTGCGAYISGTGSFTITDSNINGNLATNCLGLEAHIAGDVYVYGTSVSSNAGGGFGLWQTVGADVYLVSSVTNDSHFDSNDSGTTGYGGLYVNANGWVLTDDVTANGNEAYGANLNTGVNISLLSSDFNGNSGLASAYGLYASSGGLVSLTSVSASGNSDYGAFLSSAGGVDVTNGTFNGNSGAGVSGFGGLYISTGGAVYLDQIDANSNRNFGAHISSAGGVTLENFGNFSGNYAATGYGLFISTAGSVDLTDVSASGNGDYGAYISSASWVDVHTGEFNGNSGNGPTGYGGLTITTGSSVYTHTVGASGNRNYGMYVSAAGDVMLMYSTLDGNYATSAYGLYVSTGATTFIQTVHASGNGDYGVYISSGGDVSLYSGTTTSNNGLGASGRGGLTIATGADVDVNGAETSGNRNYGASITATGDVSLFSFNSSSSTAGYGLVVLNGGDVDLVGVNANGNFSWGANVNSAGYVYVEDGNFNGNQGNGTTLGGLTILSNGDVALNIVYADGNVNYGAMVDPTLLDTVIVTNSQFNGNHGAGAYGLKIADGSQINVFLSDADGNTDFGASAASGGDVAFLGGSYSGNGGTGLIINSGSFVDIQELDVNGNANGATINAGDGLNIYDSEFSGNSSMYGFLAVVSGDVTMDLVTADGNAVYGGAISGMGNVVVTNSEFNSNMGPMAGGLGINMQGNVYYQNVAMDGNAGEGGHINVYSGMDVTVVNSEMLGNGGVGLKFDAMDPGMTNANVYLSRIQGNSGGINATTRYLTLCGDIINGNGVPNTWGYMFLVESPVYPCFFLAETPTGEGLGPQIVEVEYTPNFTAGVAPLGTASHDGLRGLIFRLIQTGADGSKTLWAEAAMSAGTIPAGSNASFVQVAESGLPLALPAGTSFVGPAVTFTVTDSSGTALSTAFGSIALKIRLPDGFTVPAGQTLAIMAYDSATSAWVKLPAGVLDGYAYAYTNIIGTYVLTSVAP